MTITKIITDNDGVNIDSEDLAMRIMDDEAKALFERYAEHLLKELPENHIYREFPGTSTDKIVNYLIHGDWNKNEEDIPVPNADRALPLALMLQDCGFEENKDSMAVATYIANQITLTTIDRFNVELPVIRGVIKAWKELQAKFGAENTALATTSRGDRMDTIDNAIDPDTGKNAGLGEIFPKGPRRFTGYGFKNKYDAFFAHSGWNPSECAVVEDSISGVRYAKTGRPDTKVIGTVAARFYEDKDAHSAELLKAGADIVLTNMEDLPKIVDWLNADLDPSKKPNFMGYVYVPVTTSQLEATPKPPSVG